MYEKLLKSLCELPFLHSKTVNFLFRYLIKLSTHFKCIIILQEVLTFRIIIYLQTVKFDKQWGIGEL